MTPSVHAISVKEWPEPAALTRRPAALARAILAVLKDDSLRRRLVAGGNERVQSFSVDETVEKTEQLYLKLLRVKKGGSH